MAAPYLLESDVAVMRKITIRPKWVHGNNGTDTIICYPPVGDPEEIEEPLMYDGMCAGNAYIALAGSATNFLMSCSFGFHYTKDTPERPALVCPDDYGEGLGSWTETVQTYKDFSATFYHPDGDIAWNPDDVEGASFEQNAEHSDTYHSDGLTSRAAVDESMEIVMTASGTFDVYGRFDSSPFAMGDFRNWGQDHDPYGSDSRYHEVYYIPKGTITLSITCDHGTHSETLDVDDFADRATFEAAFKYGFGMLRVVGVCSADKGSQTTAASLENVLDGQFEGSGFGDTTYDAWDSLSMPTHPDTVYYNPGTGEWHALYSCDASYSPGFEPIIEANKGAFDITYQAAGSDWVGDGERNGSIMTYETHDHTVWPPVDGMEVALNDSETFSSVGHYYLYACSSYGGNHDTEKRVTDYWPAGEDVAGPGTREETSEHTATYVSKGEEDSDGGLQDLAALGEPAFPEPLGSDSWRWYDDSRAPIYSPYSALHWTDALTFTVASELELIDLGTDTIAGDWTATEGACNITYVGGRMLVEVTSEPCRIQLNVDVWCTGARRVELDYEGDDLDSIELQLNSHVWSISTSDANVDVIAPDGRNDVDITQLTVTGNGWAGGLNNVTSLEIGDLRIGFEYSFKTLKAKRASSDSFIRAEVVNQGFIGSDRGENNLADPYTGTRQLILIVDGIYAQEALTADEIGTVDWFTPGDHGLITTSFGDTDGGWKDEAECHSWYLQSGVYAGASSVTIPARVYAEIMSFPCCYSVNPTLEIEKQLRGGINVVVGDPGVRAYAERQVTIEQRHTPGGAVINSWVVPLNRTGAALAGPFQQPLDGTDNIYTVKIKRTDLSWLSGTIEVRNRSASQICLVGPLYVHGLLYDPSTGELHYEAHDMLEYA